jgi:hypothetical protein
MMEGALHRGMPRGCSSTSLPPGVNAVEGDQIVAAARNTVFDETRMQMLSDIAGLWYGCCPRQALHLPRNSRQ